MRRLIAADGLEMDAYRLETVPPPEPGPREVRIRVAACGVGYVDALVALGRYQVRPPLPHTPGSEAAGVIEAVGPEVVGFAPGERVMASVRGGFAEQAIAPVAGLVRLPEAMSYAQAAGFRVNYVTALHALEDRAALAPGERLLVLGAGGGVGLAAVEVGRRLGAHVIACASSEAKREAALAAGAHAAIGTGPEDFRERVRAATEGAGPDVVFDPVCGPLFEPAFRSLGWRGRHLVIGFAGGHIPALKSNLTLMKGAALVGADVRQHFEREPDRAAENLGRLLGWVASGEVSPPVGRVFGLEAGVEALSFALSGQGVGKTILAPNPSLPPDR